MTINPLPARQAPPRRSWTAGRVAALVLGALLLLPGLGLLAGGGTLLWAHHTQRTDGVVLSPEERFASDGSALVSTRIHLDDGLDWLPLDEVLHQARVEVTGSGSTEVFVGIAPAADARAYLEGVRRTVVEGLGFDGPATGSDQLPGGAPVTPPTDQDFWTAQAVGPGTERVTWDPAEGDWVFVLMNADGSAGVDVRARIGAEFPALGGVAWGALAAGLVLASGAGVLPVAAVRRRPRPAPRAGGILPAPREPADPTVESSPAAAGRTTGIRTTD